MDRRSLLGAVGGVAGALAGCASLTPTTAEPDLYVATDGANWNPGTEAEPFQTISVALNQAAPGDTIHVAPGVYEEQLIPSHGGAPGEPITITGPPDAVLKSTPGKYNVVFLRHSHIHITGLTIDGLHDPSAPEDVGSYSRAQLVQARPLETTDDYLRDIVVAPHRIGNSQKSLVSLERTRDAVVGPFEVIGPAGVKHLYGDAEGHNGEIVYLGTAPGNLGSNWHPWTSLDRTRNVRVHHIDNRAGHSHAELVDAKAGTRDVVIEYCTDGGGGARYLLPGASETAEAAIHLGGNDCTLRWNVVRGSRGQAVQVGSWGATHPDEFRENKGKPIPDGFLEVGRGHAIYGNHFLDFGGVGIEYPHVDGDIPPEFGPEAQAVICGNRVEGPTRGHPSRACGDDVPTGDGIGVTGGDPTRV